MEKNRICNILIFFGKDEKIAESFLLRKGITADEIAELEQLGYIHYVSDAQTANGVFSKNKQYMITKFGKEARNV